MLFLSFPWYHNWHSKYDNRSRTRWTTYLQTMCWKNIPQGDYLLCSVVNNINNPFGKYKCHLWKHFEMSNMATCAKSKNMTHIFNYRITKSDTIILLLQTPYSLLTHCYFHSSFLKQAKQITQYVSSAGFMRYTKQSPLKSFLALSIRFRYWFPSIVLTLWFTYTECLYA